MDRARLRRGDPDPGRDLGPWLQASRRLKAELTAAQPASLFNPAYLSRRAKRRLPG